MGERNDGQLATHTHSASQEANWSSENESNNGLKFAIAAVAIFVQAVRIARAQPA